MWHKKLSKLHRFSISWSALFPSLRAKPFVSKTAQHPTLTGPQIRTQSDQEGGVAQQSIYVRWQKTAASGRFTHIQEAGVLSIRIKRLVRTNQQCSWSYYAMMGNGPIRFVSRQANFQAFCTSESLAPQIRPVIQLSFPDLFLLLCTEDRNATSYRLPKRIGGLQPGPGPSKVTFKMQRIISSVCPRSSWVKHEVSSITRQIAEKDMEYHRLRIHYLGIYIFNSIHKNYKFHLRRFLIFLFNVSTPFHFIKISKKWRNT